MEEVSNKIENPQHESSNHVDFSGSGNNSGFKPKSEEDVKKEQRTRRAEKFIGSLGDSLMSLSNLFFTTKGAPNMYAESSVNNKSKPKNLFLSNAIAERHKAEDEIYNTRYKRWEEEQKQIREQQLLKQQEEEKNRTVKIRDDFGILESNWGDEDFINQIYTHFVEKNDDPNISRILDSFQYTYEPVWKWTGSNWFSDSAHDKRVDNFKGKEGSYLKRDLIYTLISDDEYTTPENREKLIKMMSDFDKNWIRLK